MNRMVTAAAEVRLHGRGASGGCALGRIVVRSESQDILDAQVAQIELPVAMRIALDELRTLQQAADETAAEILQFQIELLEDPELTVEALAAVDKGTPPSVAFRAAMQEHLRLYEAMGSEYLRERAIDVRDLRDRVLRALTGQRDTGSASLTGDCVLLAQDLTPSAFVELDLHHIKGLATRAGSPMSHVAILARARGIPLIVQLQGIDSSLNGRMALLDGAAGSLLVDPSEASLTAHRLNSEARAVRARDEEARASEPAVAPDGRVITVYLNVDTLDSLVQAPAGWFDGIGLTRTELLFDCSSGAPDEVAQAATYARLFEWSAGRPTTIRLLDAGGDKPVPGLTSSGEANPFLGVRGVRALLRQPEVLRAQLRAIVAAGAGRATRILVPMVTIPQEMAEVRAELQGVLRELGMDGSAIHLGMMVETPAAALMIERFDAADFFSIGTNDLHQYLMAAARDNAQLEQLHAPTRAVLTDLVGRIVVHAKRMDREVSVCGDAAADPTAISSLLAAGVTALSVPAHRAPSVKSVIRAGAFQG